MTKGEVNSAFEGMGISLSDHQCGQFVAYYEMLVDWNLRMNLTAITESDEVLLKHFMDSVVSAQVVDYGGYGSLIDVGTGAGFPGIPLKIVFPHLQVTLVDALNKRIGFLNAVIEALGLEGIEAIHGRAEDLARTDLRDAYDLCVSRAVSQLNVLCEYCMPFIKVGGQFISYKGSKTKEELEASGNAIEVLGGRLNGVTNQVSLSREIKRGFVMIDKVRPTEERYPRRAGKPLKKPL